MISSFSQNIYHLSLLAHKNALSMLREIHSKDAYRFYGLFPNSPFSL